ncbi:MAG: twin-arginine translocase TatA/TatE family subunit [Dehalococcoidia bacterium]
MFRNFGIWELLLVLLIVLLVFGAAKLPQIGESLGKAIRNFRKGLSGEEDKKKEQIDASKTDSTDTKKDDTGKTT